MLRRCLLVALAGATAIARAEPLTFDAALQIATRTSPEIAAQTANVEAARAASSAAGHLPDPKLALGIDNLPVTGPDRWSTTRDFMTMRKVGVMQDVPNSATRAAQSAVAEAAVGKAEAERQISLLSVRRDTAIAWLQYYHLQRREALFGDLERENKLFARAVEAQLAAGRGMPADVVQPSQEAADIADRRDELHADIVKAKAQLKRWVGSAADEPITGEPPSLQVDSEHLREHLHQHPDLAVFVPMTQMAQAEVHAAEATKIPDWGVSLAYGRRGADYSDMVSLQFVIDLPLFTKNRQDPQIRAKRQELTRVETERDAMFREHTQELEGDLAQYEVIQHQLARLRETHLALAQQKTDYTFASYRSGKGDLSSVLAARRELIDVRFRQIELESKLATAAAKLYYFYGPGAQDPSGQQEGQR